MKLLPFAWPLRWRQGRTARFGEAASITIFQAFEQQLGLRLDPSKAPIRFLYVDHAERLPIEN